MINSLTSKRLLATSITMVLLIAMLPTAQAGAPSSITPGQCGAMDIAFIVDTTGSMGGEIGSIINDLPLIIADAQLASQGSTLRLGLITFDGFTSINTFGAGVINQDFVRVHYPLTTNVAGVQAAITGGALALGFGAGGPESSDQAKATAINLRTPGMYADAVGVMGQVINDPATAPNGFNIPWAGTTNIAILITDAPAGGYNDAADAGDTAFIQALGTAAGSNVPPIRMSDIYSGPIPPTGIPIVDAMATIAITELTANAANSGGVFLQVAMDGSGTSTAIMDIIAMCGGQIPEAIGGEILPVSSTSLLIAGAGANAALLIPILAGIIGAGAYFTRSYWNKSEE